MMYDDLIVTVSDTCAAGLCAVGSWRWFKQHGLDYAAFLDHGLTVKELKALNDAMADLAIAARVNREQNEDN